MMHNTAENTPANWDERPLGSPGCDYWAGGEACHHQANEVGMCATGLCPVTVELTEEGRRALAEYRTKSTCQG